MVGNVPGTIIDFELDDPRLWWARAYCFYVVDGDTVDMTVDRAYCDYGAKRYRIAGIDTPELNSSNAQERDLAKKAKSRVEELLLDKEFLIKSQKPHKGDKYGRWLAEIYIKDSEGQETTLGAILIKEGLAREYTGGKRQPWF